MSYNDLLTSLTIKEKDKRGQGEAIGEWTTSIVRCHATLLVHCMTFQITTPITQVAFKAEINCEKTLGR